MGGRVDDLLFCWWWSLKVYLSKGLSGLTYSDFKDPPLFCLEQPSHNEANETVVD